MEITFPDEDIAQEELIQTILGDAPEFSDCLINVYSEKNIVRKEEVSKKVAKISKPCPSCRNRELHVFHVDKETLLDLDLPKECDTFEVDYLIFMCRACHHYFQNYKVKK